MIEDVKNLTFELEDTNEGIDFTLDENEGLDFVVDEYSATGGTYDYNELINQPQINGVTLIGNRTSTEIHVQGIMDEITEQDIDIVIYG